MSWYKVTFTPREIVDGRAMQMQNAFETIFLATAGPRDAGLFSARNIMANEYFFSPGAARIAMSVIRTYSGAECPAPRRSEVGILVSHAGAEGIPFEPES